MENQINELYKRIYLEIDNTCFSFGNMYDVKNELPITWLDYYDLQEYKDIINKYKDTNILENKIISFEKKMIKKYYL